MKVFTVFSLSVLFLGASAQYSRKYSYYGATQFFDKFHFATESYNALGFSTFVNQTYAQSLNMIKVIGAGNTSKIYIGVDNTTVLPTNSTYGRNAIRIQTNAIFNSGLFILSLDHMPTGTTTWPAFWSFGPNWPGNGEIDILEGIYNMNYNSITTHTTNSCTFANATCSYQGLAWNGLTHEACNVAAPSGTFNTPFNNAGGGVFAMEWVHNSFIKIWNFVKPNIPADITNRSATPNPNNWPSPVANFVLGSNCTPSHFQNHTVTFDTTFCGWASQPYPGGETACEAFVRANPGNFSQAYFLVNYLDYFCQSGDTYCTTTF